MHANLHTIAFRGVETINVSVQIHLANGLPAMRIVGLADKAVAESRERVQAALASIGLSLPPKRIAINLSPADLAKEGAHYDLPIALSLLVAMGAIPADMLDDVLIVGELSLDGHILPIAGTLLAAINAASGQLRLICPASNGPEAAWAGNVEIIAAPTLNALLNHLRGNHYLPAPVAKVQGDDAVMHNHKDMSEVKGQEMARRALEIAAAGGHHLLMIGPPGAGKSMLASRLSGLLPPLTPPEALGVTMIHSIAGNLPDTGLIMTRPFRDPHHSASIAALVGGGIKVRPGEISLAHNGVLFLDELPEFSPAVLDGLRQPLETGEIVIARAQAQIRYPAQFQLIAAMNPCRCGYPQDPTRNCGRNVSDCMKGYISRISGPMLDRFDMILDVAELDPDTLLAPASGEASHVIAARVKLAREKMLERGQDINVCLSAEALEALDISKPAHALMKQTLRQKALYARGYHKMLRVARTIADLASAKEISELHMAEALHYRQRELRA